MRSRWVFMSGRQSLSACPNSDRLDHYAENSTLWQRVSWCRNMFNASERWNSANIPFVDEVTLTKRDGQIILLQK